MMFTAWLRMAVEQYGYIVVLLAVGIESMGVPFPGETALIAGAVYAGTGGQLSIAGVIAAAAAGAILGDNLGYAIGRSRGHQLLRRLAPKLHLNERHLAYAESFFWRHGDKTVFLGRFFAILRTWAAFLAGVNRMPWRSFLLWNALGGIIWSLIYGTLGYVLGNNLPLLRRILRIMGWGGTLVALAIALTLFICWRLWRRGALRSARLDAFWARVGGWLVHPHLLADRHDDPPSAAPTASPAGPPAPAADGPRQSAERQSANGSVAGPCEAPAAAVEPRPEASAEPRQL